MSPSTATLSHPLPSASRRSTPRYAHDLPPDCPPGDATLRRLVVYRIVKNDPPCEQDLRTHAELGLAQRADPCRRASLSVYSSWRQARHRQLSSPHLGEYIATTSLTPMHGPISAPTAQGHMDWWPFDGALDSAHFEVTTHEH